MTTLVATLPVAVAKRDGSLAAFDGDKIRSAIERAGGATGKFDAIEAHLLAVQATKVIAHRPSLRP